MRTAQSVGFRCPPHIEDIPTPTGGDLKESIWTGTNELKADKIIPFEPRTKLKGWPPKLVLRAHTECGY
jgi:hypothetical protein